MYKYLLFEKFERLEVLSLVFCYSIYMETQAGNTIVNPQIIILRMWYKSSAFSIILLGILLIYIYLLNGILSLRTASTAVAGTGAIMIGLSFALSGISYYFRSISWLLAYRKYFGLIGFFYACGYSMLLLIVDPQTYFYGFFTNLPTFNFILGLSAMFIFTYMALISNQWAMTRIGPQLWRKELRIGYIAYALLIMRATILEKDLWIQWIQLHATLPPPRLLVACFAISVIILRITVFIAEYVKKFKAKPALSPTTEGINNTTHSPEALL